MPLLVASDAPASAPTVNFLVSPIYELFISLSTMSHPGERHEGWAAEVKRDLSPQMREEADFFNTLFEYRLVELAVDFPDHNDVEGFFRYLETMAAEDFVFYATGRVMSPKEIAALSAHPLRLLAALQKLYGGEHRIHDEGWRQALQALAVEPDALRTRLLRLLRTYWQNIFRHRVNALKGRWDESVRERTQTLGPDRMTAVQERFLANRTLPREFPEGYPLERVWLVPSLFLSMSSMIMYGYGQMVIIYDALTSDEHRNAMAHVQRRIVAVARALEDPTRMTILRAIAKDKEYYGSRLAAKCGITPSSISRHMKVLRDAGLINEVTQDNRVMYELKRDAIERFSEDLNEYL
jgi:DNA-binding transcriptional ArsR family regulator